ncbi:MAG TPA: BrxA/BrxB family bacilliredoxin [Chitinophagales bacterium]|jgi:putative YphP/YqiW family bacilliredoxin|nr:BrxA/BrxB family bacilliredoxin [Chitinophagales bacterium]HPA36600.1 BrxA/BrxB family bacilliredoxin [Chitinophagales bacterium]HPW86745.1 BrxA/BrxB family bacilliredoxin [Chitinophagales bacterium]HQD13161.1 BrxA/BrxB family bacilliredoxin [Chitinophagales bacterium]HQO31294.1 BrxA/BrxB family bacilliredoxin [Chitinophagales bacterium]
MYPEHMTKPMAAELENAGFTSLKTPEEVSAILEQKEGTVFLVINSVCGCAAANARPAAIAAAKNEKHPDRLVTVFAGVDGAAVAKAREYTFPFPPSSPSMAVFKDGKLVHMVERHMIEGRPAKMIADNLVAAFNEYC